ncbi:pyridoxamine 5'-phosphate oxidase [Mesonia aestuariivivens]|uniref:Pyridoxamine 5'-phosphate oxidase n=1 Tax=Mesonia aestuariivivens TaxID=2796128 RepID=A0ABS6W2J9_9FLAO|nr:pyridoxamine 5'-phosphate oxidase [Mesonia aestuariivivens]MBW2962078.1 pyridoxamine 5'-phosphate oxidase [Mesonia aestuariivivens]
MDLDHNPIQEFQHWFYQAEQSDEIGEVNAMLLTTIGEDASPKSRMVLLKRFTWEGFLFFTNYTSEKGRAIARNPNVSLHFNWQEIDCEIHIQGKAEKLPRSVSEAYFLQRPAGSQLGAWASAQGSQLNSRIALEDRLLYFEKKFKNKPIPMPKHWGGYLVKPKSFDFICYSSVGIRKTIHYQLEKNYTWSKHVQHGFDLFEL